jgi:hypothetical protein
LICSVKNVYVKKNGSTKTNIDQDNDEKVTDDENYEMYTGKVHIIQLIK